LLRLSAAAFGGALLSNVVGLALFAPLLRPGCSLQTFEHVADVGGELSPLLLQVAIHAALLQLLLCLLPQPPQVLAMRNALVFAQGLLHALLGVFEVPPQHLGVHADALLNGDGLVNGRCRQGDAVSSYDRSRSWPPRRVVAESVDLVDDPVDLVELVERLGVQFAAVDDCLLRNTGVRRPLLVATLLLAMAIELLHVDLVQ